MSITSDGGKIRRRRLLKGLSQREFAQRAGYTNQHVSQVELGNSNAGPAFLRKAARILGCEVSDLMTEGPGEPASTALKESGNTA